MHPSPKSLYYHLYACVFLLATVAAGAADLFDFGKPPAQGQLTTRAMTVAVTHGALEIKGYLPASERGVVFPLPEKWLDLSRFRHVEADFENTGDKPLMNRGASKAIPYQFSRPVARARRAACIV